ncbi:hypothetical protein PA598K_06849 [Paenibacillus sp. 598K]|uniref:YdcF family protein n=1 Tax=Paenibacillus sp. 598K TaxID=1117987 RepID=UPI000FF91B75|nr:YdcF family protein [Paenibacillus sp. 598K]GBF78232.1 hypothetical protein PA598K_06849 [Paenibacillus sp. 598K]
MSDLPKTQAGGKAKQAKASPKGGRASASADVAGTGAARGGATRGAAKAGAKRSNAPERPVSRSSQTGRSASSDRSKRAPAQAKRTKRATRGASRGLFKRTIFKLLRIGAFAAALGVFWCGYMLWQISSYTQPRDIAQADVGIVLGAALWNNVPSLGLGERLDYAIRLYEQGRFESLIVSGGLDNNGSTITEAQGMRNYLVDHGIPPGAIAMEPESTSTYENLLFSKSIMEAKGWQSAIIISHDFHSARSHDIAGYLRMEPYQVVGTKTRYISYAKSELREVLAYTKWQLDKLAMLTGVK